MTVLSLFLPLLLSLGRPRIHSRITYAPRSWHFFLEKIVFWYIDLYPFSAKLWKTSSNRFRCSLKFLPKTITSSRYTRSILWERPAKSNSISLWKAHGADASPIRSHLHICRPRGVIKAVKIWLSSSIVIWKYPDNRSMFENYMFFCSESLTSLTHGKGKHVFSICLFRPR